MKSMKITITNQLKSTAKTIYNMIQNMILKDFISIHIRVHLLLGSNVLIYYNTHIKLIFYFLQTFMLSCIYRLKSELLHSH